MTNRIYCGDCKVFFKKLKTGFTVKLAENLYVRGDQYVCPTCDKTVYGDFGEPFSANYKVTETA